MKSSNGNIPIEIIDTAQGLARVAAALQELPEIFIDTEFDDFNAQYGLHLQLIQVFDGTTCFLIDPIRIKNLDILWLVFENEHICKVVYRGANDVAILKKFGCNTRNIFDNQVAAGLCGRAERSYAALIQAEFGIETDKSQQRSRWDNRPLKSSQVIYASDDVIYLPRLKEIFLEEIGNRNLLRVLQEENRLIESSIKKDYQPKLSGKQKAMFSHYARTKLMEFKNLVNRYAQLLNVPPYYIVPDQALEAIIKDKAGFMKGPFGKDFYKDVLKHKLFKAAFLAIVDAIDSGKGWENKATKKIRKGEGLNSFKAPDNESFLSFKQYIINRYGEVAGNSMLKGLSKIFSGEGISWEHTRQYQKDLYNDFLAGS